MRLICGRGDRSRAGGRKSVELEVRGTATLGGDGSVVAGVASGEVVSEVQVVLGFQVALWLVLLTAGEYQRDSFQGLA